MEHCGAEPRVKQLRWVNDSSVNLEFYSAEDAAAALVLLTHPDVMNANELPAQDSRIAKAFSKQPDATLRIRETNSGDQKPRGAARNSNYYQRNPDIAGNRQREKDTRRRPPKKDFLDYGEEDSGSRDRRRRNSGDESMEDGGFDRRRNRRNDRDNREPRRNDRSGRLRDDRDSGRLRDDVDSYRPGSRRYNWRESGSLQHILTFHSPRESRTGRLRGRSASPGSGEEGDGRYGFAEDNSNLRTRYRSRSRSRNNTRRRREPSGERWAHDLYGQHSARGQKESYVDSSPMGNHRRSDAMDKGREGGSLLARMTKDGQPVLPQKRSLADRMTRDNDRDDSFGRLKGDDSEPFYSDFSERDPKPRRNLVDRISRDTEINIRGKSQEGINIKGAGANGQPEGINIRGVASGI